MILPSHFESSVARPTVTGRLVSSAVPESHKVSQTFMPSARRKAFFASFLSPPGQKGRRPAGRDPPILILNESFLQKVETATDCEPVAI